MQNQIPKNWQKVKLGDVLAETPQYGYTASSTKSQLGPKLLRITDIQNDSVDWESVPYCEISEKEKSKYLLEKGDIVFARTGNTTGANFYLNALPKEEAVFASYLIRVRPDKKQCLSEYLAYFFRSRSYWGQVKNLLSGSAQPGINASNLQNLTFDLPEDIETQKEIISILSVFDDKIEVNNKIAKNLEEMAQALFKEWFVKFKFPGYEKVEFVDSELGKIPKGWLSSIGENVEVTDYVANGSFASLRQNVTYFANKNYAILVRTKDLQENFTNNLVYINQNAYEFLKKSKLFGGELILSNVGNVGAVFRCPKLDMPMSLGPNAVVVKNSVYTLYLFLYFTGKTGQSKLRSITGGSSQPKFNKTDLRNLKLIIPSENIMKEFNKLAVPIYDRKDQLEKESQKLAALRDLLLPKLMRGEIRITN